jgi:two-component system, cell cycle sensor histidine kinase and response regulator CckA
LIVQSADIEEGSCSNAADYKALESELLRLRQENADLRVALHEVEADPVEPEGLVRLKMFRSIYDDARHLAVFVDAAGIVRHANPTACLCAGKELSSVVGIPVSAASWLWDSEEQRCMMQAALVEAGQGQFVSYQSTWRARDGSLCPIELTLRPCRQSDGQVIGLIIEARDVARWLQMETALDQAHQTLESVLEQSPVAMIVATTSDGVVRYVNRAAVELIDCGNDSTPRGQLLRELFQRQAWQTFRPDGSPIPFEERTLARALRGETVPTDEQRLRRKDGSFRSIVVSGAPIYRRSGELIAAVATIADVTEEKSKTEQLRQLAAEQRTILQTIRAGIVLVRERKVQWVNAAFSSMFAYGLDELRGVDTAVFYADRDEYERVGRDGYAEIARGNFFVTDARMRRSDGAEFWCNISGNAMDPERFEQGSIWVLQDVSEQRKREDALRSSERKLAEIFRSSPEMLMVSHADTGDLIEVNDAFTRLTGFTREEALHRSALEIGLWPSAEHRAEILAMANERGELRNHEGQLHRKSGELIDVLFSYAPFSMDGEKCLIWIVPDMTEYKRIQKVVRDGEERFNRLVENSIDLIVVVGERGEISSVIGPLEAVFGYELEDVCGKEMLSFVHPDDVQAVNKDMLELLAEPGATHRSEHRLINKRGESVYVESVVSNWAADPVIRGIVCNIRDVSARKRADLERARLQAQLQQAMKMEAVGRLAGGVAHDFNNLLTVISGNLELARDELDAADPVMQPLIEIERAASSAAALTKQLLAFSRQQIIEPRALNINDLISNLRKMLVRLIGEDIDLRVRLAERLGAVRVDPGQFEQVIINLAINARDAMPLGGTLTLETADTELDDEQCRLRSGTKPGPYVMLAVTDSGHGMTEDVKRFIFEPFFTTKPKGHGTGLGLPMILGIVQQAGGTIDVYSEFGQGATFKLFLPRIDEPAQQLTRGTARRELPRGSESVLLVEDEPSVRMLAETMLKRLGYVVVSAANGDDALRLAEERGDPIALLMTDVVMPGMSGRELAERLRARHPETQVLFTSGYTEDEIIHRGVLSENLSFISKPYSMQTLAFKLRQVLAANPRSALPLNHPSQRT